MAQPIKKTGAYQKPRSKTVKKRVAKDKEDKRLPQKPKTAVKTVRKHPKYGTSKLEKRFATEYLDKIGVEYVYQYEAKSIGRFFDFMILGNEQHPTKRCCLEIDGQYWHADKRLYEEKDLNRIQKHNRYVDEVKNKWCSKNGIPLIRISEYDINHSPDKVLEWLREKLKDYIKC